MENGLKVKEVYKQVRDQRKGDQALLENKAFAISFLTALDF